MKQLLVMVIPLWLLIGCDETTADHKNSVSKTVVGSYLIVQTIDHDGHKFVAARTGSYDGGMSIVHHPSCECFLKSESKK